LLDAPSVDHPQEFLAEVARVERRAADRLVDAAHPRERSGDGLGVVEREGASSVRSATRNQRDVAAGRSSPARAPSTSAHDSDQ